MSLRRQKNLSNLTTDQTSIRVIVRASTTEEILKSDLKALLMKHKTTLFNNLFKLGWANGIPMAKEVKLVVSKVVVQNS